MDARSPHVETKRPQVASSRRRPSTMAYNELAAPIVAAAPYAPHEVAHEIQDALSCRLFASTTSAHVWLRREASGLP